jgi:exodeoxyribonuclease VII small subunit
MENKELNFESRVEKASKLLNELTKEDIVLSKSVEVYKAGLLELKEAQNLLDKAKLEFEQLNLKHN